MSVRAPSAPAEGTEGTRHDELVGDGVLSLNGDEPKNDATFAEWIFKRARWHARQARLDPRDAEQIAWKIAIELLPRWRPAIANHRTFLEPWIEGATRREAKKARREVVSAKLVQARLDHGPPKRRHGAKGGKSDGDAAGPPPPHTHTLHPDTFTLGDDLADQFDAENALANADPTDLHIAYQRDAGFSWAEIAAELDVSVRTVQRRYAELKARILSGDTPRVDSKPAPPPRPVRSGRAWLVRTLKTLGKLDKLDDTLDELALAGSHYSNGYGTGNPWPINGAPDGGAARKHAQLVAAMARVTADLDLIARLVSEVK